MTKRKWDVNGNEYPMTKQQHVGLVDKATCAEELPCYKPGGSPFKRGKSQRWNLVLSQRRPEIKAKRRASAKAMHARPETKARHKAAVRRAAARPEVKAARIARLMSPEVVAKAQARLKDPEVLAKRNSSIKASHARPEVKARLSAASKRVHACPKIKAKRRASLKASHARPEVKARLSAASKKIHARPGHKEKHKEAVKKAYTRPEVRARHKEAVNNPDYQNKRRKTKSQPEVRAKITASLKAAFARPGVRARKSASAKAAGARPEVKAKRSASLKAAWKRPETIQRHRAVMAGKSFTGKCREFRVAWIYYFLHPLGNPGGKLGFASSDKRLDARGNDYSREGWGVDVCEGGWMQPGEFAGFELAFKIRAKDGGKFVPFDIEQFILNAHGRPVNEVLMQRNSLEEVEAITRDLCEEHGLEII